MSDSEFKPKPLTAAETLKLNLMIAAAVIGVFVIGAVIFHYHVDQASPFAATAPAAAAPAPAHKL